MSGFSRLWFSGSSLYLMETYELFGDPALVINRTPAAVDDFYGVAEDFTLNVTAENGVLKNDFGFSPANELTASLKTDVAEEEVTLLADGSFTYKPAKDWFGQEEFTYKAFDNGVLIGTARATISVYSINDTPVAYPQSIETMVDTPVEIFLTGSDVDGDALTYTITKNPDHGMLSGTAPNLTYSPNEGYSGSDSFVYIVRDGKTTSTPATISITVFRDIELIFLPLILR
ncbi:MAG: cadherin-like domain-containing protein [Syntrophomonadaceae bacterium]|nr:cadherin-like domain-containing protein [Syntrophomonadaceae bacterium]